ncbi:NAD(P)H-dependent oxidoreductase [Streptomyces kronopolitis]
MKVLWLFAHPDRRSLSGSLMTEGLRTLDAHGHRHRVSDLYAMKWNPVVDAADYAHDPADRLLVGEASERAYHRGHLAPDIRAEQEKLTWADTVIVQFPLWWYGMPALLKGWFDRVFVKGFAFGLTDPATGRPRRYGDGKLTGKRAMVITTAGARAATLGPRGVNGDLNDLLFPLQHGTLWYTGISVVPPLLIPSADRAPPHRLRHRRHPPARPPPHPPHHAPAPLPPPERPRLRRRPPPPPHPDPAPRPGRPLHSPTPTGPPLNPTHKSRRPSGSESTGPAAISSGDRI